MPRRRQFREDVISDIQGRTKGAMIRANTNPLVSVVMVNYNNERFIGDAIESVVTQTYSRWELIIVENESTDDSWQVIQSWTKRETRIEAVRLSRGISIPAGRNLGLVRAAGEYIAALDSDD